MIFLSVKIKCKEAAKKLYNLQYKDVFNNIHVKSLIILKQYPIEKHTNSKLLYSLFLLAQ